MSFQYYYWHGLYLHPAKRGSQRVVSTGSFTTSLGITLHDYESGFTDTVGYYSLILSEQASVLTLTLGLL